MSRGPGPARPGPGVSLELCCTHTFNHAHLRFFAAGVPPSLIPNYQAPRGRGGAGGSPVQRDQPEVTGRLGGPAIWAPGLGGKSGWTL